MSLKEEYQNTEEKLTYYSSLPDDQKIQLYKELDASEQQTLLSNLPFQYIKKLISISTKEDQKDIYQKLTESQVIAIYNTLNSEEKKQMAETIAERQADLLEELQNQTTKISDSNKSISEANTRIENSAINLANARVDLVTNKQDLKQSRITLKKLDKERAKNLKRVLKASKPSILDRVAIISKYRTQKLQKRVQELDQTTQKIDQENIANQQIRQNITNLQTTIVREKENIQQAKQQIIFDKKVIHETTKNIGQLQVTVKQLSKTEKRVLGRKLYKKQVDTRNSIATIRNQTAQAMSVQNSSPQTQSIEPVQNIIDNSSQTKQTINNLMQTMDNLQQLGVDFSLDSTNIGTVQPDNLLDDPIAQMTPTQAVTMTYAAPIIVDYQKKLKEHQTKQQLQQGRSRTLKQQQNAGNINVALLTSIILFILSLFLLFIK